MLFINFACLLPYISFQLYLAYPFWVPYISTLGNYHNHFKCELACFERTADTFWTAEHCFGGTFFNINGRSLNRQSKQAELHKSTLASSAQSGDHLLPSWGPGFKSRPGRVGHYNVRCWARLKTSFVLNPVIEGKQGTLPLPFYKFINGIN